MTSGSQVLMPGNTITDFVVLDDFLYGEPPLAQVPEPTTLWLLVMGLFALGAFRLRAAVPANRQRFAGVSSQR